MGWNKLFIAALRQYWDVKLGRNHKNCDIEMGYKRKERYKEDIRNVVEEILS